MHAEAAELEGGGVYGRQTEPAIAKKFVLLQCLDMLAESERRGVS
jgi:hypothetical protein